MTVSKGATVFVSSAHTCSCNKVKQCNSQKHLSTSPSLSVAMFFRSAQHWISFLILFFSLFCDSLLCIGRGMYCWFVYARYVSTVCAMCPYTVTNCTYASYCYIPNTLSDSIFSSTKPISTLVLVDCCSVVFFLGVGLCCESFPRGMGLCVF